MNASNDNPSSALLLVSGYYQNKSSDDGVRRESRVLVYQPHHYGYFISYN